MKKFLFAALLLLLFISLSAGFGAYGYELGTAYDYLPDSIRDYLPSIASQKLDSGELLSQTDVSSFFTTLLSMLSEAVKSAVTDFASLAGILIAASLIHISLGLTESESLKKAGEYVGILCVTVFAYRLCGDVWTSLDTTLSELGVMVNALLGSMTALYTAGGNVTTAAVTSCTITASLVVMQNLCEYLLRPLMTVCLGFTIVSAVTDSNLNSLAELTRNIFTLGLTFIMMIFSAILSYQTSIASGADNLAARTVKFTAGTLIPIVGGAVGDSIRVLAGGLELIKNTVGWLAILAIGMLTLPLIFGLLIRRLNFSLAAAVGELLGCPKESAMLRQLRGLLDFALALASVCTLFFVFMITVFLKAAFAVSA